MGAIIYWAILRFAIVLVSTWLLYSYVPNYGEWWMLFFIATGVVVIYPAQIAYRQHLRTMKRAHRNALCATCRHFIESEVLCSVTDEHVTQYYTPCEGQAWEPS